MPPYDISQLRLSHQILRLRPDQLLLELRDLRALRLLVLQLLDLIRNLALVIPARLHRALRIPDLLQHAPVVFQVLREHVFLLAQLGQQHPKLVRDVRDGVVARRLAPVGKLGCDGDAFPAGGLVGADAVVLALDDFEQLLAEFWLLDAA
jgi:hypothetical protein